MEGRENERACECSFTLRLCATDPSVAQAMPSKLKDAFVFLLEQFFLIRDFWIFSSSSSSYSVNDLAP